MREVSPVLPAPPQAAGSKIVEAAHKVIQGSRPDWGYWHRWYDVQQVGGWGRAAAAAAMYCMSVLAWSLGQSFHGASAIAECPLTTSHAPPCLREEDSRTCSSSHAASG